jgi:hypothetical protein
MSYLIGIILALAVCISALLIGLSRDRAFYPTVLIVIASYYVLFAVMGGSHRELLVESLVMCVFAAIAVAGFNRNLWLVVAGLAAHGLFDAFHGRLQVTSSVPPWWPAFCLTFDVTAAVFLALLVSRRRLASRDGGT